MMKRILSLTLVCALLLATLSFGACASDYTWDGRLGMTNVIATSESANGSTVYYCEETTNIVLDEDVTWINLYYFSVASNSWEPLQFDTVDYYGNQLFDSTGMSVIVADDGTYSIGDYLEGLYNGTIDYDADFCIPAGSSFDINYGFQYILQVFHMDDTQSHYNIMVADAATIAEFSGAEEEVEEEAAAEEVEPAGITATATAYPVYVDGEEVAFEAYNIADTNYFKLRDIAAILDGTEASFELTWNQEAGAIEILSDTAYTAVGGEMTAGDGSAKTATVSTAKIYLDGVEIELEAYTINDNNYFRLRDLGEALGFNVSWDSETMSIVIASDEEYTAD